MHIKDIVVITHEIGNLHEAYYGLIPGDRVPATQSCILQLLLHADFTRCIPHVMRVSTWLSYTKCIIIGHGIMHRNEIVVKTWNYQMIHVIYYIYRLVHMNIVIVSTCEYTFVVTHLNTQNARRMFRVSALK